MRTIGSSANPPGTHWEYSNTNYVLLGLVIEAATGDDYASQLHARVFARDGQLFVEDLGSTNGTYLNRQKVHGPQVMRRGDRLQVGNTVLELA